MRVIDLEKFAREEIWRPFWPTHPDAGPRAANGLPETYDAGVRRTGHRHSLTETLAQLRSYPGWRSDVIGRLTRIGVTFPHWVVHPLVDYLRAEFDAATETGDAKQFQAEIGGAE